MILVNRTSAIITPINLLDLLTVITFIAYLLVEKATKLIIILEKEKITEGVKKKLVKKGLSLIATTDKEIIFNKIKRHFLH